MRNLTDSRAEPEKQIEEDERAYAETDTTRFSVLSAARLIRSDKVSTAVIPAPGREA